MNKPISCKQPHLPPPPPPPPLSLPFPPLFSPRAGQEVEISPLRSLLGEGGYFLFVPEVGGKRGGGREGRGGGGGGGGKMGLHAGDGFIHAVP